MEVATIDEVVITCIAFHDWGGTLWFVILFVLSIHGFLSGENPLLMLLVIAILFLLNGSNSSQLKRQKAFVERMIQDCEKIQL